eukprot:PhM_4_TR18884/c0_g2_i1/m.76514
MFPGSDNSLNNNNNNSLNNITLVGGGHGAPANAHPTTQQMSQQQQQQMTTYTQVPMYFATQSHGGGVDQHAPDAGSGECYYYTDGTAPMHQHQQHHNAPQLLYILLPPDVDLSQQHVVGQPQYVSLENSPSVVTVPPDSPLLAFVPYNASGSFTTNTNPQQQQQQSFRTVNSGSATAFANTSTSVGSPLVDSVSSLSSFTSRRLSLTQQQPQGQPQSPTVPPAPKQPSGNPMLEAAMHPPPSRVQGKVAVPYQRLVHDNVRRAAGDRCFHCGQPGHQRRSCPDILRPPPIHQSASMSLATAAKPANNSNNQYHHKY